MKKLPNTIPNLGDAIAASEGFLDKVAVAQRLGVKPKTVGEWAKQGKLPAYRLGPYLRFKWAEVEAHLAATCRCVPHLPSAPLASGANAQSSDTNWASQACLQLVARVGKAASRQEITD